MIAQQANTSYGTYADFEKGDFAKKEFLFVLAQHNPKPSIVDASGNPRVYPPRYECNMVDSVYDFKKNQMRLLYYHPNETSIWRDEHSDASKEDKRKTNIVFEKGERRIQGTDVVRLQFMMLSNFNGSNPNRDTTKPILWWLVDAGKGLNVAMEEDKLKFEAANWCYHGKWDLVKAYARSLQIDVNRDPSEIRFAMRVIADRDPQKFLTEANNPRTYRKHLVLEAIERRIMELDSNRNTLKWANGGDVAIAAIGLSPIDMLVDNKTKEAGDIFETIQEFLNPTVKEKAPVVVETAKTPAPPAAPAAPISHAVSEEEAKQMIKDAIASGKLIAKGPNWVEYTLPGQGLTKEGRGDTKNKIMTDETVYNFFKSSN